MRSSGNAFVQVGLVENDFLQVGLVKMNAQNGLVENGFAGWSGGRMTYCNLFKTSTTLYASLLK